MGIACGRATEMTDLELWYRTPAVEWTDALPLGNGRLGAIVFGGIGREELQLNEETLWSGGPYRPINPEALPNLDKVRSLVFEGKYKQAQDLANAHLLGKPLLQMSYQPAGNLFIDFPHEAVPGSYRRSLDLDTAISTTRYALLGTGIHDDAAVFTRQSFVSAADNVLVLRIETNRPGALSFEAYFDSPQDGTETSEDEDRIAFSGRNFAKHGNQGRLRFGVGIDLRLEGGTLARRGRRLVVRDATAATFVIDIATSFVRFDDVSGDPDTLLAERRRIVAGKTYEQLREAHTRAHQRLFRRMQLNLGTERAHVPTNERISQFGDGGDPGLAALYVQYGRYLMLASSRPGGQPATLQGIWNKETRPPWGSKYTTNINIQMNYWLPDPANLSECFEPLVTMIEELAVTGAEVAKAHYGSEGWVLHHNTDLWRAATPTDGAQWGMWPTGGAWFCAQLWDHAVFEGRPEALVRRLHPLLAGQARFMLDLLRPLPGTELLVTVPSMSPENIHPHGAATCAGPAMDTQIAHDLFAAYLAAGEQLGLTDDPMRAEVVAARARLPEPRVGKAGQLQEWLEDWDLDVPEIHHRHVSHLYCLYPSQQVGLRKTPKLAEAVRKSLEIRGDDATGWGIGWRINLWARLGEGDHAHDVLRMLLSPSRSYNNLFDAHPPFQIDGNFGGAAGILEMLVQSDGQDVFVLPALPSDWPSGSIAGVRVRGGVTLDFDWHEGQPTRLVADAAIPFAGRILCGDSVLAEGLAAGRTRILEIGDEMSPAPGAGITA